MKRACGDWSEITVWTLLEGVWDWLAKRFMANESLCVFGANNGYMVWFSHVGRPGRAFSSPFVFLSRVKAGIWVPL